MSSNLTETTYCFNKNEFGLLLGAAGVTHFRCFDYGNHDTSFPQLSKEECNETVLGLIKTGILSVNGDSYQLNNEVRNILGILKVAEYIILYTPGKAERNVVCIYFASENDYIIANPGEKKEEYIKLTKPVDKTFQELIVDLSKTAESSERTNIDQIELYKIGKTERMLQFQIEYRFGVPSKIIANGNTLDYSGNTFAKTIINTILDNK